MVENLDELCPLCAVRNESGKLTLFQVNFGEAIKLCSRKQCPYPLGTRRGTIQFVRRSYTDIVINRRRGSRTSSRASTCSQTSTCSASTYSGGSRSSTPTGWSPWSPALTSPGLPATPGGREPIRKSGYIPSPPLPTRIVTLDQNSAKQNNKIPALASEQNPIPEKPAILQWCNKDALCWLDVIMCLLVHCKQLRKLLQVKHENDQSVLKTLITAYDQAQLLYQTATDKDLSVGDKMANLETSVGTIPVQTGGGQFSPVTCLPSINAASVAPNAPGAVLPVTREDDDFFKCLDDLDFDLEAESTKFDIQSLEDLLDGSLTTSPVKSPYKSPVRTMVQTADKTMGQMADKTMSKTTASINPANTMSASLETQIKTMVQTTTTTTSTPPVNTVSRDVAIAQASLLLEDVREQVWQSISAKMRCQKGKDDSPIFAIPLLLKQSRAVDDLFNLSFTWSLTCTRCGHRHVNPIQKTLTTFPSTPAHFNMRTPCFMRACFNCKTNNQQMNMIYTSLPKVMMMHFVEGLPESLGWSDLDFTTQGGERYEVSGAVQYKTNPGHFVAWLRDHS